MPVSPYIVLGCTGTAACIIIFAAIVLNKKAKGKTRRLFTEMQRDDAIVQSECMIRNGGSQYPGVALIADDILTIKSVSNKVMEIPMGKVSIRKEGRRFNDGWMGKIVFYLDTPETHNLEIGVEEPGPWREAFERGERRVTLDD